MHFCLVFTYLQTGGIQTLMVRMANWLESAGHQVTVVAGEDGPMRHALPAGTTVIVDGRVYQSLARGDDPSAAKHLLDRRLEHGPIDVFYCFCHDSLWVAAALLNTQGRPAKCLAGVYTLGDYLIGPRVRWSRLLSSLTYPSRYLFQYRLPPACRVYVNSAMQEYVQAHSRVCAAGRIWPLPVDGTPYQHVQRRPERGLIVSIGRLAPMKEYNLWMIDVIRDLLRKGHDVRWEVYGEGPMRTEMERRIRERGVCDRVSLMGEIAYACLPDTLARAMVYVGMGTTLVEAAFAGVPAVVARAFDTQGLSYGYFHQLPEYSCGEPVDRQLVPVAQLVGNVLALEAAQYEKHAAAERAHAERFSLEHLMPRFVELAAQAPSHNQLWRPSWSGLSSRTYRTLAGWWRGLAASRSGDPAARQRMRLERGTLA